MEGIGPATALFNNSVPRMWHDDYPGGCLERAGRVRCISGCSPAVPVGAMVISRSGFPAVLITVGISGNTISTIGMSGEGITRQRAAERPYHSRPVQRHGQSSRPGRGFKVLLPMQPP